MKSHNMESRVRPRLRDDATSERQRRVIQLRVKHFHVLEGHFYSVAAIARSAEQIARADSRTGTYTHGTVAVMVDDIFMGQGSCFKVVDACILCTLRAGDHRAVKGGVAFDSYIKTAVACQETALLAHARWCSRH